MIWQLGQVDETLLSAFVDAGPLDQAVIDQHMMARRDGQQNAPMRPGIKRWYYLQASNARISLACVGMPLSDWQGGAFLIVGTRLIIGEFVGNQAYVGKLGLQMKMQPLAWLQGEADRHFASGAQLLAEISEQILDRREIEASQRKITRKYRHTTKRRKS